MPSRIVVCLDGTWNSTFIPVEREDGTQVLKPTNPLKIARAVKPIGEDGITQITYYDSGVGALGLYPGISNRILSFVDSKLGGAWGAGFEANVEQAANFISNNFTEGDELFVFGFSRGAAQARALTQFLDWLGGIPPKRDSYYVPLFFKLYFETKGDGDPRSIEAEDGFIPADHLVPVRVRLLGVFDTVMALGSRLRASTKNSVAERSFYIGDEPAACVLNARQALAIDERRYDFRPEIWRAKKGDTLSLLQRWFPGVHGNTGGSYGNDGLANCALHWMVEEAEAQGLQFDRTFLSFYREYFGDELGQSYTSFYKFIDAIRFKLGKGRRPLAIETGSANISIDKSAIYRYLARPSEHEFMRGPYRPKNLVKLVKSRQHDWTQFLESLGIDPNDYPYPDGELE